MESVAAGRAACSGGQIDVHGVSGIGVAHARAAIAGDVVIAWAAFEFVELEVKAVERTGIEAHAGVGARGAEAGRIENVVGTGSTDGFDATQRVGAVVERSGGVARRLGSGGE